MNDTLARLDRKVCKAIAQNKASLPGTAYSTAEDARDLGMKRQADIILADQRVRASKAIGLTQMTFEEAVMILGGTSSYAYVWTGYSNEMRALGANKAKVRQILFWCIPTCFFALIAMLVLDGIGSIDVPDIVGITTAILIPVLIGINILFAKTCPLYIQEEIDSIDMAIPERVITRIKDLKSLFPSYVAIIPSPRQKPNDDNSKNTRFSSSHYQCVILGRTHENKYKSSPMFFIAGW